MTRLGRGRGHGHGHGHGIGGRHKEPEVLAYFENGSLALPGQAETVETTSTLRIKPG